jgi:chloride channel, nucleotide-sensitive, 1A
VHIGEVKLAKHHRFASINSLLFMLISALLWKFNDRDEGISIPWTKIGVHAISSAPAPSVYFIIDINLNWPGVYEFRQQNNQNGVVLNHDGGDEEDENDEGHETDGSDDEMTEFWLIPSDQTLVTPIYNAMKDCQVLHPDPADSVDDSEEDGKQLSTEKVMVHVSDLSWSIADDFMEAEDNENEEDEGQGQGGPDLRNLNLNDGDNDDNKYADAD